MRARPLLLNATTTTDICTLSLHDALPICGTRRATRTAGPDPGSRCIRQPDTGREAAAGARGSGDYQAPHATRPGLDTDHGARSPAADHRRNPGCVHERYESHLATGDEAVV